MRFVIIGAGAIGGTVGAALHQAGHEVLLVARGAHYEAITAHGLTFETPQARVTLPIPVRPSPAAVRYASEDVALVATKTQDTGAVLSELMAAAPATIPVICAQNGVENERLALRRFEAVYGAVVMSPTAHLEPGIVLAYGTTRLGTIDIGCYPSGVDARCEGMCAALRSARFLSDPRPDIMRHKHAKLLANLGNAVEAICGPDDVDGEALEERAGEEGRSVLDAEGTEYAVQDVADIRARWRRWGVGEIAGRPRGGGSSWQSVVRGTGNIEADYLNGEIVLRGRLLGIPTPVNALLQRLAYQTVREGRAPGWLAAAEVLARLDARPGKHAQA